MKKTIVILVLLLAAVSAFALSAKVLDAVGKVEVQQADGSWAAVGPGSVLGPGSILSTGFKSEAVISIDESTITVKALTRLTIEQLYEQQGNKASSFYLDAGALSADVKSAEDKRVSFTVKTPAVTASVRGTAGDLTVNTLVGTSGTWLLLPPQPKAINYDRGDAVMVSSEELVVSTGDIGEEMVGAAAPEETEEAGQAAEEPAGGVPAGEEASGGESAGGESSGGDMFDWSINNGDVTVQPGQAATFEVGKDIVTPMETAAAAATKTGGSQTLSSQESVSSSAAPSAPSGADNVLAEVQASLSSDLIVGPKAVSNPGVGSISVTLRWPE